MREYKVEEMKTKTGTYPAFSLVPPMFIVVTFCMLIFLLLAWDILRIQWESSHRMHNTLRREIFQSVSMQDIIVYNGMPPFLPIQADYTRSGDEHRSRYQTCENGIRRIHWRRVHGPIVNYASCVALRCVAFLCSPYQFS